MLTKDPDSAQLAKDSVPPADLAHMIRPISNVHVTEAHQASLPPAPKPEHPQAQAPQTVKSGAVSRDQVTLKSAGDVDHDGDSK
jgi:hypothetical protein